MKTDTTRRFTIEKDDTFLAVDYREFTDSFGIMFGSNALEIKADDVRALTELKKLVAMMEADAQ